MPKYYVQLPERELALELLENERGTLLRTLDAGAALSEVLADFAEVAANPMTGDGLYSLIADGRSYQVHVTRTDSGLRLQIGRHRFDLKVLTEREWRLRKVAPRQAQGSGRLVVSAPMPGLVKAITVAAGDEVRPGQRLVVLEAMKMENEINAPRGGKVLEVHTEQGATIDGGKPLVTLE